MPQATLSSFAEDSLSDAQPQPPKLSDIATSVLNGSAARSTSTPPAIPGMEKLGPLPPPASPPPFSPQEVSYLPSGPSPKAAGVRPDFGQNVVSTARTLGEAAVTPYEQGLSQALGTPKPPTMLNLYDQASPALAGHAKTAIDTVFGRGTADRLPQDFPWLEFAGHLANESARAGMSILDFGRSPLGMAVPEANRVLPPGGKATVGAGFAASMEPGTEQQIRQAVAQPTQENVARAVVTSAVNALPAAFSIPSLMEARRGSARAATEPVEAPPAEAPAPVGPADPQINQAARRATVLPPEQGIPEQVARAVDARERLAQKLTGKPFAELPNSDRMAIDDLVSQGYLGGDEPPASTAPTPPATAPRQQAQGRPPAAPQPAVEGQAPTLSQIAQQVISEPASSGEPTPSGPWLSNDDIASTVRRLQLPEETVRAASTMPYEDLDRLANHYNDEYQAAIHRGETLAQITDRQIDTLGGLYHNLAQRAARRQTAPEPAPTAPSPESAIIPPQEIANAGQRTIESPKILGPRGPSNPVGYGEGTAIRVAGSSRTFEANYAIREAEDVYPSHDPVSFGKNPDYQLVNDRDYAEPEAAARVLGNSRVDTFEPSYLINDNPDATNGPPIIDRNGNVLGGNSRTMIISRVYGGVPEAAAAYKNSLIQKATQFGFNPDDIAAMRRPVLVRELSRELSREEAQRAITAFNQPPTAALRPAERAIADSRGLSPQTLDYLSGKIDEQGPDGTLAQALEGRAGPDIVNHLVQDGVITPQERPQYIDERGVLTADGKQRIARLLTGRLFDTPDQFENTPPSLRGKLERIVAPLARLQGRADWDLMPQVRQALSVLEQARAHGISNLQDLAGQQDLFGNGPRIPPDVFALAQRLRDDGPRKLAQAFSQYAQDERMSRPGEPATFIEPPAREQAFQDAFGNEAKAAPQSLSNIATDVLSESTPPKSGFFGSERGSAPLDPLGVGQFAREDILPVLRQATATAVDAVDRAQKLVAPQTRGEAAGNVALSLRHGAASMVRAYDQEVAALSPFKRLFRISVTEPQTGIQRNYDFINRMEKGTAQATPEADAAAMIIRTGLDARRAAIQALGTGKLEAFYENYFPRYWERPQETVAQSMGRIGGKRPLQGPASFLKQRAFETFQEGIDAGYKPLSDNPVDFYLWKSREMDRYLMGNQFLKEQKDLGLAKFVKAGQSGPDGWEPLPDPIGNVYYRNNAGELVTAGNYYMPSEATQVVSNFLSPGLRGNPLFRAWLGTGNLLLRARLGLSAFHGGFSAMTANISQFSLGLEKALRGDFTGAASAIAQTPIAFLEDLRNGGRFMQEWKAPGTTDPQTAALANAYEAGGGRSKMDQFYAVKIADKMMDAARRGNVLGAMFRLPGAAIEVAAKPVMEWMVPRMKFAAFSKMAEMELERLGPNAPKQAVERAMGSIVDTIDNRYGQLIYENSFLNKVVKDIGMSSVQSLGWNLGTFKLFLGGAKELGQAVVNREINPEAIHNLSFMVSLPIVHAAAGAILNYLGTGQAPQNAQDLFFPRTGGPDEKGRPSRWFLPDYVKDAVHMYQDPQKALTNKLHPIINTVYDMLTNRDFWGTEIRHKDDPWVQQALETLQFLGKQVEPYSFQGIEKQYERGVRGPELIAPMFGLSPAPAYINKSAAERLADEYAATHAGEAPRTRQQFDRSRAIAQVANAIRQHQDVSATVSDLMQKGILARSDLPVIRRHAMQSQLASQVSRITLEQALNVYNKATDNEKQSLRPVVFHKLRAAATRPWEITPATRQLAQSLFGTQLPPPRSAQPEETAPGNGMARGGIVAPKGLKWQRKLKKLAKGGTILPPTNLAPVSGTTSMPPPPPPGVTPEQYGEMLGAFFRSVPAPPQVTQPSMPPPTNPALATPTNPALSPNWGLKPRASGYKKLPPPKPPSIVIPS